MALSVIFGISSFASESSALALSDDVIITGRANMLIGDGMLTNVYLSDGNGNQAEVSLTGFLDPKTKHHDQFSVGSTLTTMKYLAKDSLEEQRLIRLVIKACHNTLGTADREILQHSPPNPPRDVSDKTRRNAILILGSIARRNKGSKPK